MGERRGAVEGVDVTIGRADFLVIGGGVIGLAIARELKRRDPSVSVILIEKEPALGRHASGRNTGVLHAGFYYTADSLKARFCRDGNRALTEFCEQHGLAIRRSGKLVVARDASELGRLEELFRRAHANGVPVERLNATEARKIEPRVKTFDHALWSPTTATVDPAEVMEAMHREAAAAGVDVRTGVAYRARRDDAVETSDGPIAAGFVVNAAGLYADRIARDFGFARHYRILPFKGLYLYGSDQGGTLHTNVYPVPDLEYPFLGVHFTVTVDGHSKIGPTAIPCLWREQYGWRENFRIGELTEIVTAQLGLLVHAGFDFRGLAREEMRKYHRPHLVSKASELLDGVRLQDWKDWGRPGIRAQLLDTRRRTLVMDFCTEGDDASFHVLNAVSPAFTCSIPFSRHVCDLIQGRLHHPTPDTGAGPAHAAAAARAAGGRGAPRLD